METVFQNNSSDVTRILVVDDEESVLTSIARSLELFDDNFAVGCASSAEQALEIMNTVSVDILVTDLKLPHMDGLSLTRHVQDHSPDTQSILMTAYGNEQISNEAEENGCLGYLQKPFDIDSLLGFIKKASTPRKGFHVDLIDLHLSDVFQLYTQNKRSAVLSVISNGSPGMIVIESGVISHVQFGSQEGPEALIALLECEEGTVSSLSTNVPTRSTLSVTWEFLQSILQSGEKTERLKLLLEKAQASKTSDQQSPTKVVNGAAFDRDRERPSELEDFEQEELTLSPEPPPPEEIRAPTPKERRDQKLKEFINEGVGHFKAHRLEEAKKAWTLALRIDDSCVQAKRNLTILEKVMKSIEPK